MANELTVSVSASFSKSGRTIEFSKSGVRVNVTGDRYLEHVQNIDTTQTLITFGDVGKGGLCIAYNLDTTNYVEIRPNTGVADLIKLLPSDFPAVFRVTTDAVPYAIADTAACEVQFILIDA